MKLCSFSEPGHQRAAQKSHVTLAYFMSMFSRGILTFSSFKKPLSTSLKPNLGPISPTTIPRREKQKVCYEEEEENKESKRDTQDKGLKNKQQSQENPPD